MKNSMIQKSTLWFGIFSFMLLMQSCDPFGLQSSGDLITLDFDESDFHGLDLNVPADAALRIGDEFKVEITCEETAMPYVETRVDNGILKVYFSRNIRDVDHMKVVVTAPSWDNLDISGSGEIRVLDALEGHLLKLEVSGSGKIAVAEASFDQADLNVSGSGKIDLSGSAEALKCRISGSGQVDCLEFPVHLAEVHVSGSGDAFVHVTDALEADISGSGNIIYQGNPQLSVHVSGSGSVKKH